jgi:hypothetical protein
MKKSLLVASGIAGAILSSGAMAQVYVSADIGVGHLSTDCMGVPTCHNNSTSFKITGGYKFGAGFAGEVGYIDFGKSSSSNATGDGIASKFSAFTVGAAYEYAFNAQFGAGVRMGLASIKGDTTVTSATYGNSSGSNTNTAPYVGLFGNYAVAKNVKLEGGVDWSNTDPHGGVPVRSISVGARYEF